MTLCAINELEAEITSDGGRVCYLCNCESGRNTRTLLLPLTPLFMFVGDKSIFFQTSPPLRLLA